MINSSDVVAMYEGDKTLKISDVADHFGIKPADVSSILRLSGVRARRGFNQNGPSAETIQKAVAARQVKALSRQIAKLVATHGSAVVEAEVTAVSSSVDGANVSA